MSKAHTQAGKTASKLAATAAPTTPAARGTSRTRPAEAAAQPVLRPALTPNRALDQELEWFFVYAETALGRESVGFLPSYMAASVFSSKPTEDVRLKALDLALTVQGSLRSIQDSHASVLRCVYTPRRWPRNVEAEFRQLAPIVVRFAVAKDPWPARSAHAGLEDAAAMRLSARLVAGKPLPIVQLKAQASRLLVAAVEAYTQARAT